MPFELLMTVMMIVFVILAALALQVLAIMLLEKCGIIEKAKRIINHFTPRGKRSDAATLLLTAAK